MFSGHVRHERCGVLARDPDGCDVQRAGCATPQHRDGVACGAKPALGDADHGYAESAVQVRAQPGAATGVEIDVTIDEYKVDRVDCGEYCGYRRQFPVKEVTGLVRRDLGKPTDALLHDRGKAQVVGHDQCRASAAGRRVVHIDRTESPPVVSRHAPSVPGRPTDTRGGEQSPPGRWAGGTPQ